MTVATNVINADNNTTAASPLSTSAIPTTMTKMSDPVTPSRVNSKLNPAVAAFTPSNNSSKESVKLSSAQTSSPTKDKPKPSVAATDSKEGGFVPPHLRHVRNISTEAESITASEDLLTENKIRRPDSVITSAQSESSGGAKAHGILSIFSPVLPHLRHSNTLTKTENVLPPQVNQNKKEDDAVYGAELLPHNSVPTGMKDNVQNAAHPGTFVKPDPGLQAWLDTQENVQPNNASSQDLTATIKDTLIDIDSDSPQKGNKKAAILPPGFIPFSANDGAPAKTQMASPTKTEIAPSPATVFDSLTTSDPTAQNAKAATEPKASTKAATTEKERNAAFLAQYNNVLDAVYAKYSRDSSRNSSSKDKTNETEPSQTKPVYSPQHPLTYTHPLIHHSCMTPRP